MAFFESKVEIEILVTFLWSSTVLGERFKEDSLLLITILIVGEDGRQAVKIDKTKLKKCGQWEHN